MHTNLNNPIFVTQPFLPPLEDFIPYLEKIWESHILTNNGPFHEGLEKALREYLGVKYISLFSNGTLALVTALQALKITGEVITTPYSFVATTHALWWNNIKPIFVDILDDSCNIDPEKIEAAITPQTTAILPVHVYGNPCNVDRITKIAETYGLKVIYDACHAFGVKINNESLLNFGDLSVLSFHATKVFNTFEGGAIICHDEGIKKRIDFLKNFGFADETIVVAPGINAKMNEVQAAFGLLNLKFIDEAIKKRKDIAELYRCNLAKIKWITFFNEIPEVIQSYPYFPIFIDSRILGKTRDEVFYHLKSNGIHTRRYFYPLISQFPTYKGLPSSTAENLPIATKMTEKVLCLPIYPTLSINEVNLIIKLLIEF